MGLSVSQKNLCLKNRQHYLWSLRYGILNHLLLADLWSLLSFNLKIKKNSEMFGVEIKKCIHIHSKKKKTKHLCRLQLK